MNAKYRGNIPVVFLATAIVLLSGLPIPAAADYPDREITLIVGFRAGAGADATARSIQPYLSKYLGGAKIAVVNKTGSGGALAFTEVMLAKPDGYKLGIVHLPHAASKQFDSKSVRFTPDTFTWFGNITSDASTISVLKSGPFKDFKSFMKAVKADPGKIRCAFAGTGGVNHLSLLTLQKKLKLKITLVPFKGGAPARNALLGGHVDAGCTSTGGIIRFQDKLRILAVARPKRFDFLPDVPTFRDLGVDHVFQSHRALAGPKNIPPAVVKKITEALEKTVKDPAFLAHVKKLNIPFDYIPGPKFYKYSKAMEADFRELWRTDPWKKMKKKK